MRFLYLSLFLTLLVNAGFSQPSCSNVIITLDQAAGVNESFEFDCVNWADKNNINYPTRYEVSVNDILKSSDVYPNGYFVGRSSHNSPGEYKYTIKSFIDGLGYCSDVNKWISILKTVNLGYTARSNTVLQPSGGKVFFVNSNGELSTASGEGGTWSDVALNYSATRVLSGTTFTEETSNGIFYVGTDHKIYTMSYNGGWHSTLLNSGTYARGNTDLKPGGGKVFFLDNNRALSLLWDDGGSWGNAILNINAPKVKDGTGFTGETPFGIFYVSENNQLVAMQWSSGNGWNYSILCNNVNIASGSDIKFGSNKVFYINSNGRMFNVWLDGSTWVNGEINLSAPSVKSGCHFYVDASENIYYISSSDSKIYKIYFSNGSWNYTLAVDRQLNAMAGITMVDGNLFFVRDKDSKIYYYESNKLKSAKIKAEDNLCLSPTINIFPNPSHGRIYVSLQNFENSVTKTKIRAYNLTGQRIYINEDFNTGYIDLTGNPSGIYFIEVEAGNMKKTEKIILQ